MINTIAEGPQDVTRLLDQNEVAEILGVSTKTLEFWRWKGIGPKFIKLGKLVKYLPADIQEFIKNLSTFSCITTE